MGARYWLAVHKAGDQEASLRALVRVLPFLEHSAQTDYAKHAQLAVLIAAMQHTDKEQLSLATDPSASWQSPRLPYIHSCNVVISFCRANVCNIPILPPFSILYNDVRTSPNCALRTHAAFDYRARCCPRT